MASHQGLGAPAGFCAVLVVALWAKEPPCPARGAAIACFSASKPQVLPYCRCICGMQARPRCCSHSLRAQHTICHPDWQQPLLLLLSGMPSEGQKRAASGQPLTAGFARHVLYRLFEGAHTSQLPVVVINNGVFDRCYLWCSCMHLDTGYQPLAGHTYDAELANTSTVLYESALCQLKAKGKIHHLWSDLWLADSDPPPRCFVSGCPCTTDTMRQWSDVHAFATMKKTVCRAACLPRALFFKEGKWAAYLYACVCLWRPRCANRYK